MQVETSRWSVWTDEKKKRAPLIAYQLSQFSGLPVIGGKQCEAVSRTPQDGETFKIGQGISVKALYTPCHTQDSICYFMEDGNERVVFTGDTLFIGGRNTQVVGFRHV